MEAVFTEKWNGTTTHPGFTEQLSRIEPFSRRTGTEYQLGNVRWGPSTGPPSDTFFRFITNLRIDRGIINPPIVFLSADLAKVRYVPVTRACLLLIDSALMSGSQKRYPSPDGTKMLYSEHSGILKVTDRRVVGIEFSLDSTRMDDADADIYLPANNEVMNQGLFLFHTHPFTDGYGGRLHRHIVYEIPSSGDLYNFVKYRNSGFAQASFIAAPEGVYIIRPLVHRRFELPLDAHDAINRTVTDLEEEAMSRCKGLDLTDADTFHQHVSADRRCINQFNRYLSQYNLFVEYYPRVKEADTWKLPLVSLVYLPKSTDRTWRY